MNIFTCYHVNIFTCYHVNISTCYHVNIFTCYHVNMAVRQKIYYLILILFRSTFHMRKNRVRTKSILIMFQRYSGFCNMQMNALWRHLLHTDQINFPKWGIYRAITSKQGSNPCPSNSDPYTEPGGNELRDRLYYFWGVETKEEEQRKNRAQRTKGISSIYCYSLYYGGGGGYCKRWFFPRMSKIFRVTSIVKYSYFEAYNTVPGYLGSCWPSYHYFTGLFLHCK